MKTLIMKRIKTHVVNGGSDGARLNSGNGNSEGASRGSLLLRAARNGAAITLQHDLPVERVSLRRTWCQQESFIFSSLATESWVQLLTR